MKSILLTRAVEDNQEIIQVLENSSLLNCNLSYISCPLIEFKAVKLNYNILCNYSDLIVTSKYAAEIVATWFAKYQLDINPNANINEHRLTHDKGQVLIDKYDTSCKLINNVMKNAWVVGRASEYILKQNNFMIKYVARNVQDLIKNIPEKLYSQIIYLSSNKITQVLPKEIKREIIYKVKYTTKLGQIDLIKNSIDYVLLYSRNCAIALIRLLRKNNLLKLLANSLIITISANVANIVRPFVKKVIYCNSERPEQMLELLIFNVTQIHN